MRINESLVKKPRGQNSYDDTIYTVVEQQPFVRGGATAMMDFIKQNLIYPPKALKYGNEGTVFVEFIVEPDATLTHFKIIKGIGAECEKEAIRVLKLLDSTNQWIPGRQNGKPVRVRFVLPVKFALP